MVTLVYIAAGDALALVLSWVLALGVLWLVEDEVWRRGIIDWWTALGNGQAMLTSGLVAFMLVLFAVRGHYSRRRPFADEVLDILKVFFILAVLDGVISYLTKWQFSRSWFIVAWLWALMLVPLVRGGLKLFFIRTHRWQRPTAILGTGKNAREAAAALKDELFMGLELVAFLVPPDEYAPSDTLEIKGKKIPVVSLTDDSDAVLLKLASPQLIVALEADNLLMHQHLLQKLSARHRDLNIIPPLKGLPLYGMEMTHFFSHEVLMLTVRNNLARPGHRFVKRAFDLVASAALLVLFAPLLAFFSWKIRQSGGGAIFGHLRIGQYGRPFHCLKFRTMVPNATQVLNELLARDPQARAEWKRDFKIKKDPRITPIGAFLRETSLDELPQLWNVLKGEMSLVGPRPIIDEELERYGDQVDYYLEAPPGMTGLWQISGRNNTGYEDRVALDSWYVRNWSLWYDFVILLKTVRVVLARKGAY
ncbi:MAG: undecaprenyl-phosphate galactose phosphotransferase WbaP [Betaproteobacteria bacterium]